MESVFEIPLLDDEQRQMVVLGKRLPGGDMHKLHEMDDSERRQWQDPEAILTGIGVSAGSTFVDIGCGSGFFTRAAARLVGVNGKAYGIDISSEAIEEAKRRAVTEGLRNIALTSGKAEDMILCEGCADVVFFGIVLHDFESPSKVLRNARHMLKPGGRLANLDWKKQAMPFGPPLQKRFDEAKASALIESAGLIPEPAIESGPYHYLITARRPEEGQPREDDVLKLEP
ncbi:MAG: class I SAM-dependent methyltransferase [Chloroflexi bacterium]|nr:class I SAM-dependent methyltransferase [Chloroflexota bacterium]